MAGKTVPAVMFIEMAADMLKTEAPVVQRELREFHAMGEARLQQVLAVLGMSSVTTVGDVMGAGYLLGIATARAMLATMPAAIQAGVSI